MRIPSCGPLPYRLQTTFPPAANFLELLARRAAQTPTRVAFGFIDDDDGTVQTIDDATLYRQSAALAARLEARGLQGERVLLVVRSNRHFVIGFLACLLAGAVAVPAPCPRRDQLSHRLQVLAGDSGAVALLADTEDVLAFRPSSATREFAAMDLRTPVEAARADWQPAGVELSSLAFLQYTSGSTGEPKGVMVSHANLMANSAALQSSLRFLPWSKQLVALPLFHDMGLIVGVMQPIYAGFTGYLMPPQMVAASPLRWLQSLSNLRITHAGGPNFLFELAIESVDEADLDGLDLSSWQVAYCGAEPVRASTMTRFSDKFAAAGFRRSSFMPSYGMAEATLYAASHAIQTEPVVMTLSDGPITRTLVGCGKPPAGHGLVIVDPLTCLPCEEGREGEIWLSGPSIAPGYWHKPEATQATFHARLTDTGDGPYLRTGDLGIVLSGELYVSARLKDLIIVRGRNLAPQDLEAVAEASHPDLRTSACAAFAVPQADGSERVIVAVELKRTAMRQAALWNEARKAVRRAILSHFELKVDEVVLLRTASMPKTSSGKLQRSACAQGYRAGTLSVMQEVPAPIVVSPSAKPPVLDIAWLQSELARVIKRPASEIDPNASFLDLDVDSLSVVMLSSRLSDKLQVKVDPPTLFDCASLHDALAFLGELRKQPSARLKSNRSEKPCHTTTTS